MPGPVGRPHFLVIGHTVQDIAAPSDRDEAAPWRLGGTAAYAALLASRLGLRTAVLTAAAADPPLQERLPGVEISRVPSRVSTHISNVYTPQGRVQYIPERAAPIDASSLPDEWRNAETVLLGPVAGEVDGALARLFPKALIGASVQGWLRDIAPDGLVRPVPPDQWQGEDVLGASHVLFASDEDLPPAEARAALDIWSAHVDALAFTHGERGAEVCFRREWRRIDAFPARAVDPTGAGDVFAAAFLIRYRETDDPWEAARFACCTASFIVEAEGLAGTPDRAMIEGRLRQHTGIVCR